MTECIIILSAAIREEGLNRVHDVGLKEEDMVHPYDPTTTINPERERDRKYL